MDDNKEINTVNILAAKEIDTIQKHVEESLLFLDDKNTAEARNNPDSGKNKESNEKINVPIDTSIILSGMDNKSIEAEGKLKEEDLPASECKKLDDESDLPQINSTQSHVSPLVKQNETPTEILKNIDDEIIPINDKSQKKETADANEKKDCDEEATNTMSVKDQSSTKSEQKDNDNMKLIAESTINEPETLKEVVDQNVKQENENAGEEIGVDNDPNDIKDEIQDMDVMDSIEPETLKEVVDQDVSQENEDASEQIGVDNNPNDIKDEIQDKDVMDNIDKEDENVTQQSEDQQWEDPESVNEGKSEVEKMIEDEIKEVMSDDDIIMFDPELDIINLDDSFNVETHETTQPKKKHVWESHVNVDAIKTGNVDSKESFVKSDTIITEIKNEQSNENNGNNYTLRVIPLHEMKTEVQNPSQTINTEQNSKESSEKIKYVCIPQYTIETSSADKSDKSKPDKQNKGDNETPSHENLMRSDTTNMTCTPAKRARLESDSTPLGMDVTSNEKGQSSIPVQDLTKRSVSPQMSDDLYSAFIEWAEKYLTGKRNHTKMFNLAQKYNKCVLRLGNLPKEYTYQDVYTLIKKTTRHAGTEIYENIAFIYNDETYHSPFNTAFVKWKNHDMLSVVKALELFKISLDKLEGRFVNARLDDRSVIDWDENDKPIKITAPVPLPKPSRPIHGPFKNGEIDCYDNKLYGLSKDFLDSLGITEPLTCYVNAKNLDVNLNEIQVHNIFSTAGTIVSLVLDRGDVYLNAWIEYDHPLEAVQAISMFHQQELQKKVLELSMEISMRKQEHPQGFTKIGPGIGKEGNILKGIGVNYDIELLKHSSFICIKKLKSQLSIAKLKLTALASQNQLQATQNKPQLENKTQSNTNVQDLIQQIPKDFIANLTTAITSAVQSNLITALGFQPNGQSFTDQNQMADYANWNPNAYNWMMQMASNMQMGTNMQDPNMQAGYMQIGTNMQTGPNVQQQPNMQAGYMQTGPHIQTRPNLQTGPRLNRPRQIGPNIPKPLNPPKNMHNKNSNMQNMQTFNQIPPIVQNRPNIPVNTYIPTLNTPLTPMGQTNLNVEQTAYMHMQNSYMQTGQIIQTVPVIQPTSYQDAQPTLPYIAPNTNQIQTLQSANIPITPQPIQKPETFNNSNIQSNPVLYPKPNINVPIATVSKSSETKSNQEMNSAVPSIPLPVKRDAKGQSVSQVKPQVTPITKAKSPQKDPWLIKIKPIKAIRRNSKSPERARTNSPKYDKFKDSRIRDISRERDLEKQKAEKKKEAEMIKEKQKELERQRELDIIRDKQREVEKLKEKQRETERIKEKQREIERRVAERAREKQLRDSERYKEFEYPRSARPLLFKHLPSSVSTEDLKDKMGEIGKLVSAYVLGKGFAIVTFRRNEDAETCIEMYHLSKVDSQTIEVKWK